MPKIVKKKLFPKRKISMIYIDYSELNGKNVVLGVTGGIAAYKAAMLASDLVKSGANVDVIMTENACEFITPATFRTITKNPVTTNTFSEPKIYEINHISLAHKADVFLIAPATANIIGKIASGIADDMLSTTVMATKAPVIIAPAMNCDMYENPIVQENIEKLKNSDIYLPNRKKADLPAEMSEKADFAAAKPYWKKCATL